MEEWRPVVDFEGKYEVSSEGRVRSLTRTWTQTTARGAQYSVTKTGRCLRPGLSDGYPSVVLGRGNTRLVHRLVAEAFIGVRPTGLDIRHKNGDRTDARACNLEYGTRTENIMDAVRHGTWNRPRKLSDDDIREIRALGYSGVKQSEISSKYGISSGYVSTILSGQVRKCS